MFLRKCLGITTYMVPLLCLLCQYSSGAGLPDQEHRLLAFDPHAKNIALQVAEPYLVDRRAFPNNRMLFCTLPVTWLLCQC